MRPAFYRYSEGVRLARYVADNGRDDLMIGKYDTAGGCEFEFKITPTHLGGKTGLLLEIHDDGFKALREFGDFFRWMGKFQPKTLDDIQQYLTENGFTNCLAGEKPKAVRA